MNNQQPAIPMRNLVIFFITSALIMVGWLWWESRNKPHRLTPQQQRDVREAAAPLGLAPMGTGLGDLVNFVGQEELRQLPPEERSKLYAEAVEAKKKEEETRPKPPVIPTFKKQFVELGGDGYNLQVRFTNAGGGIDRVILWAKQADGTPLFPQANKDGREVLGPDGKPQPLHLIPSADDLPAAERNGRAHELNLPSYLLYHYASPEEQRPEPLLGEKEWTIVAHDANQVVFSTELPEFGIKITKIFTLNRGEYHVGLTLRFEKLKDKTAKPFRYQLAGGHDLPLEGVWYTSTYRNVIIGWKDKGGTPRRQLDDAASIAKELGSEPVFRGDGEIEYAAAANQYFASAICVDDAQLDPQRHFIERARGTFEAINPDFPADKKQLSDVCPRMISEPLAAGDAPIEHKFLLYQGPIKVRLLNQLKGDLAVSEDLVQRYERKLNLRTMTDYHSATLLGDFVNFIGWSDLTIFFTNLMHTVLGFLMDLLKIPVLAIVLLTVLVRLMLMPLSRRQAASMQKMQAKMAALQPQLKALEEEYRGRDPQELHRAKMKLMLDHGINPASQLGGCLMLFLQMPIFMGLYYSLQENVFFRLKPFFHVDSFIWIKNLAAPDMTLRWGEGIPFISTPDSLGAFYYLGPYLNILPILAVGLMILQQTLMTPPPADEQQAQTQKLMKWMMIVFAVVFYKTPSGLVLYFIISSLWGLAERKLFPKKPIDTSAADGKGGNGAKLKPAPPKPSWLQQKLQDVLDAAEKKSRTERRSPKPSR